VLDLAETLAEGELLGVVDALVVEHEHGVLVHGRVNCRHVLGRQRLAEVEPRRLRGEARADLTRRQAAHRSVSFSDRTR